MCKHRKKVMSNQTCISINSCNKFFPVLLNQSKYYLELKSFLRGSAPQISFWGAQTPQLHECSLHFLFCCLCLQLVLMTYVVNMIKWHLTNLFSRESKIWYPSVTANVQHFTERSWNLQSFSFCSEKILRAMLLIC